MPKCERSFLSLSSGGTAHPTWPYRVVVEQLLDVSEKIFLCLQKFFGENFYSEMSEQESMHEPFDSGIAGFNTNCRL
jgi:hypothetical protein